mmetsp:Transcript_32040/g.75122  ORF Transcript_32040/g.75122 Transcript_32040/m.75122 type:complete len:1329 (-) Transcript_32040:124-4110(-)
MAAAAPQCKQSAAAGRCTHVQVPLRSIVSWARWVFGIATVLAIGYWLVATEGAARRLAIGDELQERFLSGSSSSDAEADETLEGKMSFLLVCFLVSCLLHQLNNSVPDVMTLPLTVLLFIVGMIMGLLFLRALKGVHWQGKDVDELITGMQDASSINPHALLFILLPPLLYESASAMNWRVLRKILPSSMILAGPGVVVNTALTALCAKAVLTVGDGGIGWEASFLLASILSATDPVAVVAALQDLGAPKKLATLIEGESLMNDGSAVVFFFVFLDLVATEAPDSDKQCVGFAPGCLILYFLRLAVGGFALGGAVSGVLYIWIAQAEADRHAEVLEVAVVLLAVYGTFFLAESIHVSGVLAVVMLGMMSTAFISASMSSHGRHSHHIVFRQISYACNQVIFFGAGMITARFMFTSEDGLQALFKEIRNWGQLLVLYVCITASRALVLLLFSPLLTRLGYGVTPKEGLILVWGGLRGAVGLTLGLLVEDNQYVDAKVSSTIAFHVSGIVMLTLLVNGTTVEWFYKKLRLYPPNPFRMTYLRKVLATLEKEFTSPFSKRGLTQMRVDWFFQDVDFIGITKCVPHFRSIDFDTGGIPYPTDLQGVYECLNNLEAPNKKVLNGAFHQAWDAEKQKRSSSLSECMRIQASLTTNLKDVMWNITNTGDQRLEFRGFTGGPIGIYASARPLTRIRPSTTLQRVCGRENALGFSVVIHTHEAVDLNVGFRIGLEAVERVDELPLGVAADTIGYDMASGKLRINAQDYVELDVSPELQGERFHAVHVVAAQEPGEEWEVIYLVEKEVDRDVIPLFRCCVGPHPPAELFPSVQFLDHEEIKPQPLANHSPKRLKTAHSIGDITMLNQFEGKAQHAIITLSYELQTATETESLNQIFHAMFNTVLHQYREMHEHGLIGNESLAWLEGATGEAVDCADHELHHSKVGDFSRLRLLGGASESTASRCTPRHREVRMELARATADGMGSDSAAGTYMSMFEPVIVEYMHLELACSKASLWDKFPSSWEVIRRRGYGQLLTKVESLWAFIQAHERVLKESSSIERHPHLIACMKAIIKEARGDLEIIQLLKPRRFHYSKHLLALRVIMRRKLERLESFVEEGWLSREDSSKLEESLWDRIHAIKLFVPRSIKHKRLGTARTLSGEKSETLGDAAGGAFAAVLPSDAPAVLPMSLDGSHGSVELIGPAGHTQIHNKAGMWQRRDSTAARSQDILGLGHGADVIVSDLGDQSFSMVQFGSYHLSCSHALGSSRQVESPLTPSPFVLPGSISRQESVVEPIVEQIEQSTVSTSADVNIVKQDSRKVSPELPGATTSLQMSPTASDG